MSWPYFI